MADELQDTPAPFVPVPCSLGTWTGVDGDAYLITQADGQVVSILANGTPSAEAIEADIANPASPLDPQSPRALSKLELKVRLDALGKWQGFKSLLETYGLWDDFVVAQDLRTDHPLFTQYRDLFLAGLDLSEEQFNTLVS